MKEIKIMLSLICVLVIFLTGCADNKSKNKTQATTETETNSRLTFSEDSDYESDIIEGFNFSANLNVFYINDDSLKPVGNEISISEDTDITLTLINRVEPDATQLKSNIPLRLYLFADNQSIPFSLDDKKYLQECNMSIDAYKEQYNHISFQAKKDVCIYNIVCIYFPEDIPSKGLGEYGGVITYSIINKKCNSGNKNNELENYIEVEPIKDNFGIDIGTLSIVDNNQKVLENHFYDDVILSSEKDLYLKFNSGREIEMSSYYLMLMIDGKLTKTFDDDYLIDINCQSGTRSFEYVINKDLLPAEGLHTFQLIAVPSTIGDNLTSFHTNKIRVNIQS